MTRKKSSLIVFPSCHDFKSVRVLPDFPKKHKIQSSRIYLITRCLCFETRYSCAWANDRGLWERDCLGPSHNTRKAVNTLKLINNWSHLFEECGLCAILLGIQDNWTFFHSDWILARFHLGKLFMLKIYLLWKIWPIRRVKPVWIPPSLRRCYGRRLWKLVWILACASSFWPLFSRKRGWKCMNTIYACLFKVIIEEIDPQNCHADTCTKVSESLSFGSNRYYFRREKH